MISNKVGLVRIGHISFLTGQDRTHKLAEQVQTSEALHMAHIAKITKLICILYQLLQLFLTFG